MIIILKSGATIAGQVVKHVAKGVTLKVKLEGIEKTETYLYSEHKLIKAAWNEIDWANMNAYISESFTVGEYLRYDPKRIPTSDTVKKNAKAIIDEAQKIREAWGSPLVITSGFRPPAVNRAAGGVSNSQHLNGSAIDIKPANGKIFEFQSWLDARYDKALGYGARKGFVHIDLRPGKIRWNY